MFDFTNFRDHPHHFNEELFFFYYLERADYLERLLIEHKIEFERREEVDENKNVPVYYFIVNKRHRKQMRYLNNLTIGHFRNPFIPDRWMRWALYIFSALVMALAILGFYKSGAR